ncbi:MAG: nucleotide sugar dehydrogenase [Candidatus Omnitrophica bacterium]|nr:nucleotide sugar dehydrogenase [Candidatus Omnitrophota bacterium]
MLLEKIKSKKAKIAVVGLGYVGLPLAIAFAKKGFSVLGLDVDRERIERLKKRQSYITDVSAAELKRVIVSKKFLAYDNFSILGQADVILICVPTPLKTRYSPDISYIKEAVKSISKNMKAGSLVVLESTTYPGTTEEVILPLLQRERMRHGKDFYLCFSPERIDPGNKDYPVEAIPKVVGGINKEATFLATLLYQQIIKKVVPVSSAKVAEAVKLLENTFRLVNIGLIDEMAMMAHKIGIDIWEIIEAAKSKPFGFMPFYPGPGVGGHCIPKDPLYLYWKARHHGFSSRFIKLASGIVSHMPDYIVSRLGHILEKEKSAKNVLVVGVTYKKNIKDLRKSPAIDIIELLGKSGYSVSYYDPLIPYLKLGHIDLKSIVLNSVNLAQFSCVIIATEHSTLDYKFILKNSRLIFDTRNVYKGIKNIKVHRL